jgi:hypothetical protein
MIAARAVAVDGAGHQFFPRPALAANQHGRGCGRDLRNQSGDFFHLRVVANNELALRASFKLA